MFHLNRVTLYRDAKSGFWHLNYWLDGKRQRPSTGTANRKLAESLRADTEKQVILGKLHVDPITPVERCLDEYARMGKAIGKSHKTLDTDRSNFKGFFGWAQVRNINDVSTALINRYIAFKVTDGWGSPVSIRRFRESSHALLEFARKQGYVSKNPVADVPVPRIPEHDIRFLSLSEIELCHRAVKGDSIEPLVATAIYAGLRRDELRWLTWKDVDLSEARPVIYVRSKEVNGERWTTKTRRNRTVPVSKALYPYLVRLALRRGESPWVFSSPDGCRWDGDNLGHRLAKIMKRSRLPWNFLDFRHTFGSHLAAGGVSLFKIAKLMGNSPRVVEMHYAKLQSENLREEVEFHRPEGQRERDGSATM